MDLYDKIARPENRFLDVLLPLSFVFLLCAAVSAGPKEGSKDIRKESNHVGFDVQSGGAGFCWRFADRDGCSNRSDVDSIGF